MVKILLFIYFISSFTVLAQNNSPVEVSSKRQSKLSYMIEESELLYHDENMSLDQKLAMGNEVATLIAQNIQKQRSASGYQIIPEHTEIKSINTAEAIALLASDLSNTSNNEITLFSNYLDENAAFISIYYFSFRYLISEGLAVEDHILVYNAKTGMVLDIYYFTEESFLN